MPAAFSYGRTCDRHPELNGQRYAQSYACVGCRREADKERKRANHVRKFRGENLDDLHRLWWPVGVEPSGESRVSPHSDPGEESRI